MRRIAVLFVLIGPSIVPAWAGEAPRLRETRTQRQGEFTYFLARFDRPADMSLPNFETARNAGGDFGNPALANMPKLVSQDKKSRAIYWRVEETALRQLLAWQLNDNIPRPAKGLEFVGRLQGTGEAKFVIAYPVARVRPKKDETAMPRDLAWRDWVEAEVVIDFDKAAKVAIPESAGRRQPAIQPASDDLEGLWASAQAIRLAILENQSSDFSFYSFAREATSRKYKVQSPALFGFQRAGQRGFFNDRLYETTTGSAAITESLQMHRMLNRNFRDAGERSIDIARVPGIDIAEHPWKKMMGDKKPAPEPAARLIPHDNYYVHFKKIAKFIEFGELMDLWGTNLSRAYELNSRDFDIKQRIEKQLCLRSGWLGKTFGPAAVKGVAITGSDLYLREGSDITVIFDVTNRKLFLSAVDRFIDEARKEHGSRLQESTDDYHAIKIETFRTPLREVSLYRCKLDDFVVYSNSPAGIRRVIDAKQARRPALADMLDFQYMRTIFRFDDASEDGFAYLSDAFIRQLVGPASKIKEKRRLEALTSLQMETNAVLFTAWETGKLPDDQKRLLAASTLRPGEIYMPEGPGLLWDQRHNVASSETYNTIHFATPLIELPIDKVTPVEDQDYRRFRGQYLGLWRQFFDPIGMRLNLSAGQVRLDTYILPLIANSSYNELRQRTGGGTTALNPARLSPKTLFQFTSHISPDAPERSALTDGLRGLGMLGKSKGLDWMGDWSIVRFDDSPIYGEIARRQLKSQTEPDASSPQGFQHVLEMAPLIFQIPLTLGVSIKNPLVFSLFMAGVKTQLENVVPGGLEWEKQEPAYKGIHLVRVRPKPNGEVERFFGKATQPALYYALIDGGFYISLREDPIKDLIDHAVAGRDKKDDKEAKKPETVPVNSSLYLAPGAAKKAGDFVQGYLEWETNRRAIPNAALWQCLYQGGLIAPNANAVSARQTAKQFLAFVPVSPDGEPYRYDPRLDEVVNLRHGSARKPLLHGKLKAGAPLGQVVEQFQTIRADLRFREDGIHTVLSIGRKAAK